MGQTDRQTQHDEFQPLHSGCLNDFNQFFLHSPNHNQSDIISPEEIFNPFITLECTSSVPSCSFQTYILVQFDKEVAMAAPNLNEIAISSS